MKPGSSYTQPLTRAMKPQRREERRADVLCSVFLCALRVSAVSLPAPRAVIREQNQASFYYSISGELVGDGFEGVVQEVADVTEVEAGAGADFLVR